MKQNFLQNFDLKPKEYREIKLKSDRISIELSNWLKKYSLPKLQARLPATCFLTSLILPKIPTQSCLIIGKIQFWISGMDDLSDSKKISNKRLENLTSTYRRLIHGENIKEKDSLGKMLIEITKEISIYPLFNELENRWKETLCSTITAMEWEYSLKSNNIDKNDTDILLYEYLINGSSSIGIIPWLIAILTVQNDPSYKKHLFKILQTALSISIVARLANDLQTFEKEKKEEKINFVEIYKRKILDENKNMKNREALDKTKKYIKYLINSSNSRSHNLIKEIYTDTGQIEETLKRTVKFAINFYDKYDFITVTQKQVNEMVENENKI